MRYDLSVLWVDDTKSYYEETKDIISIKAEDIGITIYFEYVDNAETLFEAIKKDSEGFKAFDLFFIDYALSSKKIFGSDLVKKLKQTKIVSDILFYSGQNQTNLRAMVNDDAGLYEGVYVVGKDNFEEKAWQLIEKNAKTLTSLYNIRGFLMDQTSENDYTINSYIEEKYKDLGGDQQKVICDIIVDYLTKEYAGGYDKANEIIEKIKNNGLSNIKKLFDYKQTLITLSLKYSIFEKMLEFNGETAFGDYSVQDYLHEIVKARNDLAHKKLDVCRMQKYILYYDKISQYEKRKCTDNCDNHTDDFKYSLEDWKRIRRNARLFEKGIEEIQKNLIRDIESSKK